MKYLLFAGIILSCLSSCQSSKGEKLEHETTFQVTSPLLKDTVVIKDYVCQIQSINHIEMRALERGYLQKIYVDEGQQIKKGQLMFEIMPRLYQAELQKARAEANFAEIEYKNSKRLVDSNIVSENELSLLNAKWDKAKAELSLAQVHLNFTKIYAPFDGLMDRFEVRLGSLVDEGELLTKLSDNSQLWVYFNVSEAEYLDYKMQVGQKEKSEVKLRMANNKLFAHSGKIETIEADFNNETGNIPFRATFPNDNGLLRHGETGSILMEIPYEKALIIPQKTTFEILDKKYVFILDKNDLIRQREITVAAEIEDLYIIEDGLKEDDRVLLEGLRKVRPEDHIKYEFKDPKEAMSHLRLYAE